jgi:short-subunit dehydrogenase
MAKRSIAGIRGIVTGASGGIGRAMAAELARQGTSLVLVARRQNKLDELAAELKGLPGRIEIAAGDVTDPAVRERAVERARAGFGGLDLVVNNAGIGALGRFEDAGPERLRRVMEVNFFAAAEMIRTALPLVRLGKRPIVVNVGSVLGHRAIPHASEYCASKFALRGLSEALRAEFARLAIDLLLVSPGTTETDFFDNAIERGDYPWPQQRGVSAALVARRAVRAIERGRHEILVSSQGKLLVWLNRLCPSLVDRFLARYG